MRRAMSSVALDIPAGAPTWYRHWVVLEAYIRAVVCWRQYRYNYNGEDRKEQLWRLAAEVWRERENVTNDDILRELDHIVKREGYPLSAREILEEAVQRLRYDEAILQFKARVDDLLRYGPPEGYAKPAPEGVNFFREAERHVREQIKSACLRRGYSNWYGPFRNVSGL